MNKQQLAENIMARTGMTKAATEQFINAFIETITNALADGDKIQMIGFGTFETKEKAARTARNPQTGEAISIPASIRPVFKAGKMLKEAINK